MEDSKVKISPKDVELFYKLYHSLLTYTNKKLKIIDGIDFPDNLFNYHIDKTNEIRENLYEHPELIESFVSENPLNFSSEELEIINNWKNFIKEQLIVFRYLKNYTVFINTVEPIRAYGVLALNNTFEDIIGPNLPLMVETILLPFNDKIIYDSILASYSITFGRRIRKSMNDAYQRTKAEFGIITSLPFEPEKTRRSDIDILKFYLKNNNNREMYWQEIDKLSNKNSELLICYYQEMGKIYARAYKKQLREVGIKNAWFAILEDIPIASGTTKKDVEQILYRILPSEKREFVYIFQLKGK